jgi:O-acetyl-ADP-ribose deacetylase (regulator of RNase III)
MIELMPNIKVVHGDLLTQDVDVIVNAWNRNVIPWWLLLPQGVSGAIKRHAGLQPFKELARCGPLPLGYAVLTSAGKLPYKGIIHVAGINLLWMASERSVRDSVVSAFEIIQERGFHSVALPLIGAGSGGFSSEQSLHFILDEVNRVSNGVKTLIVRYAETS